MKALRDVSGQFRGIIAFGIAVSVCDVMDSPLYHELSDDMIDSILYTYFRALHCLYVSVVVIVVILLVAFLYEFTVVCSAVHPICVDGDFHCIL